MSASTRALPIMTEAEISKRLVPVIVGGTFLAYSYVREFHRAYGITRCINIIADDIKMLSSSKFVDCRIVPDAGQPEGLYSAMEQIAKELKAEDPELVLLALGCDDRHALMFSAGKERLEACGYVVPCNDYDLLQSISMKRDFYELCEKLDVPYAKAWYFSCGDDAPEELPVDTFPYPLVAKPSDTTKYQNADFPGKRKAYEIATPEELAQVWNDIRNSSYDGELVLQDFIPGGDENLRILNTFTDMEGNLVAVSGGIVALQDHNPAAIGNPLTIIGEKQPEIIENAARLLKHIKYRGYGNFDLKYDVRDGKYKFFEINIRAGRNSYSYSLGGICFITLVVDQYILGKKIEYKEGYKPFVYNCVPKYVLKKSIHDEGQLKAALKLLKTTKDPYPLYYGKDSAAHNMWAYVMYFNQIRKFKRFYWDTDGAQYKG